MVEQPSYEDDRESLQEKEQQDAEMMQEQEVVDRIPIAPSITETADHKVQFMALEEQAVIAEEAARADITEEEVHSPANRHMALRQSGGATNSVNASMDEKEPS